MIKKAWNQLVELFEGEDSPDEIVYDPVQVGGVVVGCFCAVGVLFWLLWSLLVCGGGLFSASDALVVNVAALFLSFALVAGVWWVFQPKKEKR